MKINGQTEPRLREALAAAVKRDETRFAEALRAFEETGTLAEGTQLATAIVTVVLGDMFSGKPSSKEIEELAHALAQLEHWQKLTPDEVKHYLSNVVEGKPLHDVLSSEQIVVLSFLVAASLLAGRSKAEDGARWFDYLDRVEAQLEATP